MTTREPISIENGRVEIHTPENRVWLTRHQIADLFGVFVPAVGSNIRSILKSGILREERVYRRERNRDGGIVELYSLEMIAALAFHGPAQRISIDAAVDNLPVLQDGAARLTQALMG